MFSYNLEGFLPKVKGNMSVKILSRPGLSENLRSLLDEMQNMFNNKHEVQLPSTEASLPSMKLLQF